jgi:hypothetical protein
MSHLKVENIYSPCSPVQQVCFNVLDVSKFYTYIASDGNRNLSRIPVQGTSNIYYKRTYCLFVFLALQPIVVVFSQPDSGL